VLLKLLRQYLLPSRTLLFAVMALQFVQTIAALFLPSLNAALIDRGIARGDTATSGGSGC
jgi:ATP-binding cassette subfamily B protein